MAWLFALLGCGSSGDCEFPSSPTVVTDDTRSVDQDCGYWSIAVDEHLYVGVEVPDETVTCTAEHGAGIDLPNEPIYSSFQGSSKWTFDIVGTATATATTFDVTCDDGSELHAQLDVTASS